MPSRDATPLPRWKTLRPVDGRNCRFEREGEQPRGPVRHHDVVSGRLLPDRIARAKAGVGVERRMQRHDQIGFAPGGGFLARRGLPHDPPDELVAPVQMRRCRAHRRVPTQPCAEVAGLADIEDLGGIVEQEIDAGLGPAPTQPPPAGPAASSRFTCPAWPTAPACHWATVDPESQGGEKNTESPAGHWPSMRRRPWST